MSENNKKRLKSFGLEEKQRPEDTRRYSSFIEKLRMVVPIIALGLVILLFAWPQFQGTFTTFVGDEEEFDIKKSESMLVNPRFESVNTNGEPYVVTAEKAALEGGEDSDIEMDHPFGQISLGGGKSIEISADTGVYNQAQETLSLKDNIRMEHSTGYSLETNDMFVELKEGILHAPSDVVIYSDQNRLEASSLKIIGEGDKIEFTGPTKVKLNPDTIEEMKDLK